ncbi:MAG: 3-hydroxybutyryl-CoA dehydrogenase, partial [Bdellovibrionaceae bacterium]|nr:3-hydroxybutyryl-CoA dehydrogenase [Pseudobdellovibrionaceae bacterium]
MSVQVIGVLGSGQMGRGIAQTAAKSGFLVRLADQNIDLAQAGKQKIEASLLKLVKKEKISESDATNLLNQIMLVEGLEKLSDVDLVIEAVSENPQ